MLSRSNLSLAALATVATLLSTAPGLSAQQTPPAPPLQAIQLPKPQLTGGMPLMSALAQRKTTRAFRDEALPLQTLSNLLWAAFGINRPREIKSGFGRTAPSAMNSQDIELDVLLAQGAYAYDVEANRLRPLISGDLRSKVSPSAAHHAAVTLVYVAPAKDEFAQVDVGFIGQNVYLFAASEGLNAWFYTFHTQEVSAALKLPDSRRPLYAESVGFPPK